MLNKIIVMGRCAANPEKRMTATNVPVTSVTLAVDRDFKDKDGNKETDWIDVVAFRETANFLANYFSKGRMAVVSGRLQIRSWTDKDGNKRRTAEIVADNVYFGDSKNDTQNQNSGYTGFVKTDNVPNSIATHDDDFDQLPF